jgi:hypothetical protein
VRERLAEYALGQIDDAGVREVERHLEECAGCRREAEELRDAAATVAFDLPTVAPPTSLGARVIASVVRASAPRRRTSGRVVRVVAAGALAAALVAGASIAWAVSSTHRADQLRSDLSRRTTQVGTLSKLLSDLRGQKIVAGQVYGAQLTPPSRSAGGGGAAVIVAPARSQAMLFVDVNVPPTPKAPLHVMLQDAHGTWVAGTLVRSAEGDYVLKHSPRFFSKDLSGVSAVLVVDQTGKTLLVGPVQPVGTPGPGQG